MSRISIIQAGAESARKEVLQRWLDITINLTAAKIVLTRELRDSDEKQLKPIIDLLWEDLAHTIMKTSSAYNCADHCFMSLAEWQRHDCFKGELWGRKQFGEAVMKRRHDMRQCSKAFFQNIYK